MLAHKTSLNKFKKTEIKSGNFSNYNEIKNQLQEETGKNNWKVKTKQHANEQPMDQWRN